MNKNVLYGFLATVFTWAVTALGAATVIFFKKPKDILLKFFLGFSAGVMISASFWSLLEPSLTLSETLYKNLSFIPVISGFLIGTVFLIVFEKALNRLEFCKDNEMKSTLMMFISITLHNIPEGLAVGVAFGSVNGQGLKPFLGAITIALGIAIQNFPEGAAVSIPFRNEGYSRTKSFMLGQASALVEPIFGFLGALLVIKIKAILPFALSFAAGAMIFVVVHEIIPECQKIDRGEDFTATWGVIIGFTVMTFLDIFLG